MNTTPPPRWYQEAVIYEVHVRAFADGNGDGIGDLAGLTSRLDYLQDLGVTALWLLPFYPSPLRDGGYDIASYTDVHPAYGTLADFETLLREAHARGLRIITELVINHTSRDHPWFQAARLAPAGSPVRDRYVWSERDDRYGDARIIFKDFEPSNWTWDPVAQAYYWHRFYAHQPDLNFDNPEVHALVKDAMDFWLDLGVDGLRLDAVPYLYERDGTSCENLPETHAFLRDLRAHVDRNYVDRMLLAEANQWPVDAAAYFGDGDECHMNFHFPLMPRLFMALQMEDRFPIVDVMRQTPAIPAGAQWATFLRNHDELTLEMVTEEERDYMYRVYARDPVARLNLGIRRRLAPLLRSRRKIELATALLFALPGTPVLYYGDELGMGDNVYLGDRDGVRTPMQWSGDRNAGFSRAPAQQLYLPVIVEPEFHYEAVNVEAQQQNPSSLLWWHKRLIALRRAHPALAVGDLTFVPLDNPHILALVRHHDGERLLFAANLSRFAQHAELELPDLAGHVPVELFGGGRFPVVTARPYGLSFGPHTHLWFRLEAPAPQRRARPQLAVAGAWTSIVSHRRALAAALAEYAAERPWFRGDGRTRVGVELVDAAPLANADARLIALIVDVRFSEGEAERYLIVVGFAHGTAAAEVAHRHPGAIISDLVVTGADDITGVLYDALDTGEAATALLAGVAADARFAGERGRLVCAATGAVARDELGVGLPPRPLDGDRAAASVRFGDRVVVKTFRQLEPGINAEIELGLHLAAHPSTHAPAILGTVSYARDGGDPAAVAVVQVCVAAQATARELVLGELEVALDALLSRPALVPPPAAGHVVDAAVEVPPSAVTEPFGRLLAIARAAGERIADVHLALADSEDVALRPEPFTPMHQQSMFQSARAMAMRTIDRLAVLIPTLPSDAVVAVATLRARQDSLERRLRAVQARPLTAVRLRAHGDLHLGHLLHAGGELVVVDLAGEPARPLSARRYKRSPLRDVATLLRSLGEVASAAGATGRVRPLDQAAVAPWSAAAAAWMQAALLGAYAARASSLVPARPADRRTLLDFYALELALAELWTASIRDPARVPAALTALLALLE